MPKNKIRPIYFILLGLLAACGSAPMDEPTKWFEVVDLERGHEKLWAGRQTCEQYALRLRPDTSNYAYLNEDIVAAGEAWQAVMGESFLEIREGIEENPFIDAPESAILVTQNKDYGVLPSGITLLETAIALADYGPCACQVEIAPDAWSAPIIAHALGHCFGLSHSDLPASLMFPRAKGGSFTQEMIDLLYQNMRM